MKVYETPVIEFEGLDVLNIQCQSSAVPPTSPPPEEAEQVPNCSENGECEGNRFTCAQYGFYAFTVEVSNATCEEDYFEDLGCTISVKGSLSDPTELIDPENCTVDCNTCGDNAQYSLNCSANYYCNNYFAQASVSCPDGNDACVKNP